MKQIDSFVLKNLEKTQELVDQLIDVMLNYRQSGHPGGSRSKVHVFLTLLLSKFMKWDIRHPENPFSDRFILVGGHTVPLVYATFAVLNDALREKYKETGDLKYLVRDEKERAVYPEDLLGFRRRGGLPGHAEMSGKTLFLKFNTGPSAHGSPVSAGEALALKKAGLSDVKVFAMEGDAALTAGVSHETKNSSFALGLDNLYFLIDWNNFGIDAHPLTDTVNGTPDDWFKPYGFRVTGTENGNDFQSVYSTLYELVFEKDTKDLRPNCAWFKTRKGRNYLVYDYKSHGVPHPMNSELFWKTTEGFQEKYGVKFDGYGSPAPSNPDMIKTQFKNNIEVIMGVLRHDKDLRNFIVDTLVEVGESVLKEPPQSFKISWDNNPLKDDTIYDYKNYPQEMYAKPGEKVANRAALHKWGAWINAYTYTKYKRPLYIVASADLADSTNISGFAKEWGDFKGLGEYHRVNNPEGSLLPQEITEFANAGITAGLSIVNFAKDPFSEFNGFYGACSTYGSFAYLKYGIFRLLSQLEQDSPLKIGKVLWILGHSGPETADDSRTHFGIFAPGVSQLFPEGHVINLHPFEHNEVPPLLGRVLKEKETIIALHLTRPPIEIPDREALRIPSHFEAVKGAYILRDFDLTKPKMGTVIVQGTSTTVNLIKILKELDKENLNVKVIAAISWELFKKEPQDYQVKILPLNEWLDSMVITSEARICMHKWIATKVSEEYSLSSDWDNNWRSGGTLDEVIDEAHLTPHHILEGIERFVKDREKRLRKLKEIC